MKHISLYCVLRPNKHDKIRVQYHIMIADTKKKKKTECHCIQRKGVDEWSQVYIIVERPNGLLTATCWWRRVRVGEAPREYYNIIHRLWRRRRHIEKYLQ